MLCLFSALSRRVGALHISIIIIIVIDGTQLPAIYPQHLLAIAFLQFSQHCGIEWPIRSLGTPAESKLRRWQTAADFTSVPVHGVTVYKGQQRETEGGSCMVSVFISLIALMSD